MRRTLLWWGGFSGPQALAAVGSTSALINLIVNLFIGLSVGTNVLVAQYYGASDTKACGRRCTPRCWPALIFGCIVLVIGITLAAPMLELMGTPEGSAGPGLPVHAHLFYRHAGQHAL